MPIPTPFHARTAELCKSLRWKEWAGYHAVCSYGHCHEPEYHAFRQAAGLIDVTPLYKYDVRGADAARLLSHVMVRDITRLQPLQVYYVCWCDEAGKVLDDGTVTRLDDDFYRVTAAEPALAWLSRHARGHDVAITERSREIAALALQGPTSREILRQVCDANVDALRFFRAERCRFGNTELLVTRTGYTGDLGYELWIDNEHALALYDAVTEAGAPYRMLPAGLDALDVTRIEAGFVLGGVDYVHAKHALIPAQTSSPAELGLGWMVKPERTGYFGARALAAEARAGSEWALVGLVLDWDEFEALHAEFGLPPQPPSGAWRTSVPVYLHGRQVGYGTSGAWSPILKQNLALATVRADLAELGTALQMEVSVFHRRKLVTARVTQRPFFDPPRKTATPASGASPRTQGGSL